MREIPVIPENAPFQPEQRIWLNGFLAGYFARMAIPDRGLSPSSPARPLIPLLIVYGSQTGTAEALARVKAALLTSALRGLDPRQPLPLHQHLSERRLQSGHGYFEEGIRTLRRICGIGQLQHPRCARGTSRLEAARNAGSE